MSFAGVNHCDLIDFRASLGIQDVTRSSFKGVFREMFRLWSTVNLPVIIHLQRAISVELAHKKTEGETAVHLIDCSFTSLKVIRSLIRVSMDFFWESVIKICTLSLHYILNFLPQLLKYF